MVEDDCEEFSPYDFCDVDAASVSRNKASLRTISSKMHSINIIPLQAPYPVLRNGSGCTLHPRFLWSNRNADSAFDVDPVSRHINLARDIVRDRAVRHPKRGLPFIKEVTWIAYNGNPKLEVTYEVYKLSFMYCGITVSNMDVFSYHIIGDEINLKGP